MDVSGIRSVRTVFTVAVALACLSVGGWCTSAEPVGNVVTDVIVGHNNKGPYHISWTEIDLNNVTAVLNGRALSRGEYAIDNSSGTVSFSANLLRDAIVRFNYSLTPKSKRSSARTNIPVTLRLFDRDGANLQVTGLHVADGKHGPDAGKTIVGVAGERAWSAAKVSSQLLMSQNNENDDGKNGRGMDRSVLKVGAEGGTGALRFTGSFLNAGEKFSGEKEYGITAGRHQSDFAVRFAPGKRVQAAASIKTVEDTVGEKKGSSVVEHEQSVAVAPSDTTKLSLTHTTKETQTAAVGSEKTVETSRLSLEQKLGEVTSASVAMENVTVNTAGKSEDTTLQKVSIASRPTEQVNVTAQVQQKNSDTLGEELSTSAAVRVNPTSQVAIEAAHATVQSSLTGVATDTSVALKAAAPGNTEVKATLVEKSGRDLDKYQRDISFSSRPTRYALLTGVFSQKGLNNQEDLTRGAVLELTPFSHTKLGGGYKYIQNGSLVTTITDYSASSRPCDFLEFIGSFRDREARQDFAVDSASVKLALTPRKNFSLTAAYLSNPENAKGEIQNYDAATVGARMHVGTVGVIADVSRKDDRALLLESEERSVGLELPAFGSGRLTTSYKIARLFGSTDSGSDTYTLGYKRDVGNTFNLLLSGRYTQYRGGTTDPNRVEYGADASLGIRF